MRTGVIALVMGACLTPIFASTAAKPTPSTKPTQSYYSQFEGQIDKANLALKEFINTSCGTKGTIDTKKMLVDEANKLSDLYSKMPDSEEDLLQAKEQELYIGYIVLSMDILKKQCGIDLQPVPATSDNSMKGNE